MGIANCDLATPCVPSDHLSNSAVNPQMTMAMAREYLVDSHQLYSSSSEDGIVPADPMFSTFSLRLILEIISSIRAGWPSETLQKAYLLATAGSSHGLLNPWSFTPGGQQRLSFASGSRHVADDGDGDGGQGGGFGVVALQQRPLWQHSRHLDAPQEPGPQVIAKHCATMQNRATAHGDLHQRLEDTKGHWGVQL